MADSASRLFNETPEAIAKRLMQKAYNRDGLPEIAIGVFFLIIAGLMGLQVAFQPGSPVYNASVWGFVLLCTTIPLASQWMIKKVRRRFLTGKVGYVEMKPINRKLLGATLGIACLVGAAAAFAASRNLFPSASWILAGTGIFGGAIAAFAGRLPRFIIGGVMMAAAGILVALSGVSLEMGFTILYGFAGLLSLLSGCVVFSILLRQSTEAGE
jgi:hypothetical protein